MTKMTNKEIVENIKEEIGNLGIESLTCTKERKEQIRLEVQFLKDTLEYTMELVEKEEKEEMETKKVNVRKWIRLKYQDMASEFCVKVQEGGRVVYHIGNDNRVYKAMIKESKKGKYFIKWGHRYYLEEFNVIEDDRTKTYVNKGGK